MSKKRKITTVIILACLAILATMTVLLIINQKETDSMHFEAVYEAENAVLTGNVVSKDSLNYSNGSYVEGFEEDDDSCTFEVTVDKDGFYDLVFVTEGKWGDKENFVLVDDENVGSVSTKKGGLQNFPLTMQYLSAGVHKVTLKKSWGWIRLDSLKVVNSAGVDKSIYNIKPELINKNADDNTKRLMSYLCDNYGENFISGQYCNTGINGAEIKCIMSENGGKIPAILGLDFIDMSASRVENGTKSNVTQFAINFDSEGGIVTFCWHWNAPSKYITGAWYKGFYSDNTDINLKKIMDGEDTEGYDLLMQDVDTIAKELQKLEDAGVPVIWRPLHEASGGWFWWGNSGPEAYKKLWKLLYDKLTNEYGLNNLIWLWNGQSAEWYPGDEYVDIIGEDVYPGERVYTSQINKYLEAVNYSTEKKMVVMSENGCLFDPDLAKRDGAMWGFFANWGQDFVIKNELVNSYSDKYNEPEMLEKVYNHELVITLDELPDLKNYKIDKSLK